jgi:origin recognition complex subunit 1
MDIINRLGASRLLIVENRKNNLYQRMILNVRDDDVLFALRDDPIVKILI